MTVRHFRYLLTSSNCSHFRINPDAILIQSLGGGTKMKFRLKELTLQNQYRSVLKLQDVENTGEFFLKAPKLKFIWRHPSLILFNLSIIISIVKNSDRGSKVQMIILTLQFDILAHEVFFINVKIV